MSNLYINGKMVFDDAKVKELEDRVEALESRQYVGGGFDWFGTNVSFSKESPITHTITADGILIVSITRAYAAYSAELIINGQRACFIHSPSINSANPDYRWVNLPVKAGDVFKLTTNDSTSAEWKASVGIAYYRS